MCQHSGILADSLLPIKLENSLNKTIPDNTEFYAKLRVWLLGLALFSTVLLIYASIVPLKYTPLDWEPTFDRWKKIEWLQLGVYNRADWIANALVVIPSAFFFCGAIDAGRRTRWPLILASPIIVLLLAVLVLGIELVQVWFPPRTVSRNDILAGWIGGFLGCMGWWILGRSISRSLDSFVHLPAILDRARWLVGALSFFSLAYTVYPFDFVLSWGELQEKWNTGRLRFAFAFDELSSLAGLKGMIIAAAKLFPFGLWLGLYRSTRFPWISIPTLAIALEAVQIPIYSKFATEWESIAGIGGGWIGWYVAATRNRWTVWLDRRWIWIASAIVWSVLLLMFFNLRYSDILQDTKEIEQRWADFWTPPLLRYYYTSEYSAISNLLGKLGMFSILGVCTHLAFWTGNSQRIIHRWFCFGLGWAILIGVTIEAGQIYLPPLIPDASDIAIYAAGFALGFILSTLICGERHPSDRSISRKRAIAERWGLPLVLIRIAAAMIAWMFAFLIWWHFPFARYELGIAALLYGLILWKWTFLTLPSIPSVLACMNLMPFTGWIWVGELEIFLLMAFSIAVLRYEVQTADVIPRGMYQYLLASLVIVQLIGLIMGLVSPNLTFWESANPYLHPLNSWRATKGFWLSLLFLPIIRYELRTNSFAKERFCAGMAMAASVVAIGGISERILYPGLFDLRSDYRIVSSWFDMHLGGSQIAIFLSLSIPSILWLLIHGHSLTARFVSFLVLMAVLYCLIISYARAAIAMTLLGISLLAILLTIAFRYQRSIAIPSQTQWAIPMVLVFGITAMAVGAWNIPFLHSRLSSILPDLDARVVNWKTALESQGGDSPMQWLFGHGSGSYPRHQFELRNDTSPSNLRLREEGGKNILQIENHSTLYVGQKIHVDRTKPIHLEVKWRAKHGSGALAYGLCEKVVLYSMDCAELQSQTWADADGWRISKGEFRPIARQSLASRLEWIPVDFALWCTQPFQEIEIASIRLLDDQGSPLIANDSFQQGLDRWYLSDDYHLGWRIENEFVSSWFDGGLLRVMAAIGFFFWALLRELKNSIHGVRISAFYAAIHCLTVLSFVFDTPLQAPRLASLAYLLTFLSLESSYGKIE